MPTDPLYRSVDGAGQRDGLLQKHRKNICRGSYYSSYLYRHFFVFDLYGTKSQQIRKGI